MCLTNFAERADTYVGIAQNLVKTGINIEAGRHPVIEQVIENLLFLMMSYLDIRQSHVNYYWTNMGGKSTYMRQTALIALLAYIGSFVPANRAVLDPLIEFLRALVQQMI